MHVSREFFDEIYKFLSEDLLLENLNFKTNVKLKNILTKLGQIKSGYEDEDAYEVPINTQTNLELPIKKKPNTEILSVLTLTGGLYYRYNLQCWDFYPFCYLYQNRIICEKQMPNFVNDNYRIPLPSKTNGLCIFLLGYNAVNIGNDCGMNYVFKLTHPAEETKVFAADSQEEVSKWIEQINLYSRGQTPNEEICFHDQIVQNELQDEYAIDAIATTLLSSGSDEAAVDDLGCNSHLRRQPSDVLSIINTCNATDLINSGAVQLRNSRIPEGKFNRSRSSYSFKPTGSLLGQSFGSYQSPNSSNQAIGGVNVSMSTAAPNGVSSSNSLISSMKRKVESIGNKYRNRKSLIAASSSNYSSGGGGPNLSHRHSMISTTGGYGGLSDHQFVMNHQNKSRTVPPQSPLLDDSSTMQGSACNQPFRRLSLCSPRPLSSHRDLILAGVAKLRVHGGHKTSWVERWCQLKPKLLECYHISASSGHNNSGGNNNNNNTSTNSNNSDNSAGCSNGNNNSDGIARLDFALCLDNLSLGLSNDKKHRSALRLSCESVKQDLLFEVQDKVLMGDWIKAFIEALGISNPQRQQPLKSPQNKSKLTNGHVPVPEEEDTVPITQKAGGLLDEKLSFIEPPPAAQSSGIMQRSLTTIHSVCSESVYDEVCNTSTRLSNILPPPPDESYRDSPPAPVSTKSRRWSSPIIDNSNSTLHSSFSSTSSSSSSSASSASSASHNSNSSRKSPSKHSNTITTSSTKTTLQKHLLHPPSAPYITRRCIRDHPLPSLPASSPDSEVNSDGGSMSQTPTQTHADYIYDTATISESTYNTLTTSATTSTNDHNAHNNQLANNSALFNYSSPHIDQMTNSMIYTDHVSPDQTESMHGDLLSQNRDGLACSLADLIARLEPMDGVDDNDVCNGPSYSYSTSSSTLSSGGGGHGIGTLNSTTSSSSCYAAQVQQKCNTDATQVQQKCNTLDLVDTSSCHANAKWLSSSNDAAPPNVTPLFTQGLCTISTNHSGSLPLTGSPNTQCKVSRSISAHEQLQQSPTGSSMVGGVGSGKQRPRSLLMRKTSLELVTEEMQEIRDDIRLLKKHKKDIQKSNNMSCIKSNEASSSSLHDNQSIRDFIGSINQQVAEKESRLRFLSSYYCNNKRFTKSISFSSLFLKCISEIENTQEEHPNYSRMDPANLLKFSTH